MTIFEQCQNPLCEKRIGEVSTGTWRRTPRRFCSGSCQRDDRVLRRVAAMLLPLGQAPAWEILQVLENGDTQGKAQVEIVNPGAN